MPTRVSLTPESLLAQFPQPVVELANALRPFVRTQVPEVHEVAYAGWKAIGYRHPEAGYLGAIFLFEDCVRFIFEHGHLLPDAGGILEGDTKQTRHVTMPPGAPMPFEAFAGLLRAAVDIGKELRTRHKV